MLLEHINHYNNLHFSLQFTNVSQEAPHYHKEMELVLVLRGHAKYKVHHQEYHIQTGDIFVVDTQDLHYIYESSEDVILLQFHVDMAHFTDIYPNIDVMFFVCEDNDNESSRWHQRLHNKIAFLSHHIAEMMMLCQSGNNDKILEEKLREFLYIMVDKFQAFYIENNEFHFGREDIDPLDLERLYRIMHYLYANYDKKITLGDIAENEHLSIHYLSHFIKKTSGLSFQNLLNYIRVEQAERLLNENRLTLTQISEFCGFSSPAYFNKCFSSWHDMTPSEYKKQWRPRHRAYHKQINNSEALLLLQSYLNTDLPDADQLSGGYSTNHIVIPMNSDDINPRPFKGSYPLDLIIDDCRSLDKAVFFTHEIAALSPNRIMLSEKALNETENAEHIINHFYKAGLSPTLTSIQADSRLNCVKTTAAAFTELMENPDVCIKLFDDSFGLFTSDGLPTPYRTIYKVFKEIKGKIISQHHKYILVKNENNTVLLLHNHEGTANLNVHVQFDPAETPDLMIMQTFDADANIYDSINILRSSVSIDNVMRENIYSVLNGTTKFISKDALNNFRLNITVEPDMFIILRIW